MLVTSANSEFEINTLKDKVLSYIDQNQDRFVEELKGWLAIPSISTDKSYKDQVLKAAEYLKTNLESIGVDKAELIPSAGYPVVYAEKMIDPNLPTVMIYGHYDVQPPDPLELWTSPPFEPVVKDGKIYARGACDDKGQSFMHVKAFELLTKTGDIPCNIKFMIEGEEEIGSPSLEGVLREHKDKFNCDILIISDTSMVGNEHPSITVSLRGLSYVEVEVVGPNRDLHSGVYGGAVDNPAFVLCKMINSLKNERNQITIPGFYDDVYELNADEREQLASIPYNHEAYLADLQIGATNGEEGYSVREQTSTRPTMEVNGIWGGYTGEGSKTVLPAKASAKISMRLVPNQDSHKITELFTEHFKSIAPPSVKVKVTPHHGGNPYGADTNSPGYKAAALAYEASFGKKPIAAREGGSIPILAMFDKILECPMVLMGFGLDTDAIHSPNEHFGLFNFFKGIETISLFHHYMRKNQNQ